jgi:polar amino acid transport system ATP-binding protein
MLEIKDLNFSYGKTPILKDISFTAKPGEMTVLLGANGSGKTTLLQCVNRLYKYQGNVSFQEKDITGLTHEAYHDKMSYLDQHLACDAVLTVFEVVLLGKLTRLGFRVSKEDTAEVENILSLMNIEQFSKRGIKELSGGQRQLVFIAQALVKKPELLVMDEPTSALDPGMVSEVLSVMKNLASQGLTMLVVTHEMRFARDVSSRIFYMDRGEVWEAGPPKQIFEAPLREETRDFVFRVRSWEQELSLPDYDHPAMEGSLGEFCARQFLGRNMAYACHLVVEELVGQRLAPLARSAGLSGVPVRLRMSVAEGGDQALLSIDARELLARGLHEEQLEGGADGLSSMLVARFATRVPGTEPGVMHYEVG